MRSTRVRRSSHGRSIAFAGLDSDVSESWIRRAEFVTTSLDKLRRLRQMIDVRGLRTNRDRCGIDATTSLLGGCWCRLWWPGRSIREESRPKRKEDRSETFGMILQILGKIRSFRVSVVCGDAISANAFFQQAGDAALAAA